MSTSRRKNTRKRGVAVPAFIASLLVAVFLGAAIGYFARGEPEPGPPITEESDLPTVTVTVPQAP